MNIALEDLHEFVSFAVDAGIQGYLKRTEPATDRIKQSDAKRYLARCGFQPAMLHKWVSAKLLSPEKVGEKQNSAVWYSLADIKKVICAIKLKQINIKRLPHDSI